MEVMQEQQTNRTNIQTVLREKEKPPVLENEEKTTYYIEARCEQAT